MRYTINLQEYKNYGGGMQVFVYIQVYENNRLIGQKWRMSLTLLMMLLLKIIGYKVFHARNNTELMQT